LEALAGPPAADGARERTHDATQWSECGQADAAADACRARGSDRAGDRFRVLVPLQVVVAESVVRHGGRSLRVPEPCGSGSAQGQGQRVAQCAGFTPSSMLRHLPCRKRSTLSVQRVAWPRTMASQMSAASRPVVAWKMAHRPRGTTICEMTEM